MQNDKTEKYNPLIYRVLRIISTHAPGLSGKRLRGYVFAGLLLSGKRFRRRLLYSFEVRWLGPGLVSVSVGTVPHQFLQ